MAKLTDKQKDGLRLISRSREDSDGWVKCSIPIFRALVLVMPKELVQVDSKKQSVRLTAEAAILLEWL